MADRGVPAFRNTRGAHCQAPLRAPYARHEGANLRVERRSCLQRRRARYAQRDPEGLSEPDKDGVCRGRGEPEPSLVRLGNALTAWLSLVAGPSTRKTATM